MVYLPLANVLHHKLRSALAALGIAIGIGMLVTLSGLARGSLAEVAERWEAVDADLIAYPDVWGRNITTLAGVAISDTHAEKMRREYPDLVQAVVPVFLWQMRLAGQDQLVAGVDPDHWSMLAGGETISRGRLFDPHGDFSRWIVRRLSEPPEEGESLVDVSAGELAEPGHCGLEIVMDSRLAAAGGYEVGRRVRAANHDWTIVGIVPTGGMARAYIPRRTAQFLFAGADLSKSTLLFIKLRRGLELKPALRRLRYPGLQVAPLRQYRRMLEEKFAVMFRYVDAVNAVTLIVAFLFIMNTLYVMVLQRRRDIAILKSCGASEGFILRQVWGESALLTAAGAMVGIGGSFLAAWVIEAARPLLTVQISALWIGIAVVVAAAGATLSALYPAWRATRVDMAEVLAWE